MKIALDARWIFPEISGIGTYTRELIRHLALVDQENEYELVFDREVVRERVMTDEVISSAPRFTAHLVPGSPFSLWGQTRFPGWLRRLNPDVYHSANYMIPFLAFPRDREGPIRCMVTIHDLIPLIFPDHAPKSKKSRLFWLFRRLMLEVGRRSDRIITVSESSRKDIFRHLRIPGEQQDKVLAIPEGVSDRFQPAEKKKRDHPVILYVGRFDPYKNVVGLIEAFARVVRECPGTRLRLIGPPDARYPEPGRRAVELKVDDHTTWQGYVDGDELLRAYQQADVMVLPSRYEGFGLPVLEAMACGAPVVCSNTSSLPEVAGDAALLVDPADVGQCAQAILSILTDASLARDLRQKGIQRASEFTWRRTAELTRRAYESAVG